MILLGLSADGPRRHGGGGCPIAVRASPSPRGPRTDPSRMAAAVAHCGPGRPPEAPRTTLGRPPGPTDGPCLLHLFDYLSKPTTDISICSSITVSPIELWLRCILRLLMSHTCSGDTQGLTISPAKLLGYLLCKTPTPTTQPLTLEQKSLCHRRDG